MPVISEFVDKPNLTHWQLRILAPPLDFSTPKKFSMGPLPSCPLGHHATGSASFYAEVEEDNIFVSFWEI